VTRDPLLCDLVELIKEGALRLRQGLIEADERALDAVRPQELREGLWRALR
jgi:hypothetical protein